MDTRCEHERHVARFGHDVGMYVHGDVRIGEGTLLCSPLDINGKGTAITIGAHCDIAAFVTISGSDSHLRCVGYSPEIKRAPITIGDNVFIGQGAIILGDTFIGDRCVIGAGVVLRGVTVPPNSRVRSPQPVIDAGWYALSREQQEQRKALEDFQRMFKGFGL